MQVTFRQRFGLDDTDTDDFFGQKVSIRLKGECRSEGHKWKLVLTEAKSSSADTLLSDPSFWIYGIMPEILRAMLREFQPLICKYAMVISVKVKDFDLYNVIRQRYTILNPIFNCAHKFLSRNFYGAKAAFFCNFYEFDMHDSAQICTIFERILPFITSWRRLDPSKGSHCVRTKRAFCAQVTGNSPRFRG